MIYAMREAQTGLVKIGMARDKGSAYRQRKPNIENARSKKLGRPCSLELIQWADWPHTAEMDIHRFLWREWQGDEFFTDSDRLLQVLAWMRTPTGYFAFRRALKTATDLPKQWHWMNREKIIQQHKEQFNHASPPL